MCSWSHTDPLVHRYVLPYLPIIRDAAGNACRLHLLTAEPDMHRLDAAFGQSLRDMDVVWYPMPYAPLGAKGWFLWLKNTLRLRGYCRHHRIDILHAFAPIAGALAWMATRWTRVRLVVDSWEPHAESMVETGVWKHNSLAFRVLWFMEKKMTQNAYWLIAAQPQMVDYAKEKWQTTPQRVSYRPACVDLDTFDPKRWNRAQLRSTHGLKDDALVCVCVSQLGGLYYLEEALYFFSSAKAFWGDRFRVQLITTTPVERITRAALNLSIDLSFVHIQRCAPDEVPEHLAMADFAFNPQKAVQSKRYGTPVKNGEYWAMGLPILMMKDTSQDGDLAEKFETGCAVKSLQGPAMESALQTLERLINDPETAKRCRDLAEASRSYALAQKAYAEVYSVSPPDGRTMDATFTDSEGLNI